MSDLYLVLRHRLDVVVDWVDIGTETLLNARKAKGYSYETMGRLLHVASKTWERWEKEGRIRRDMVEQIADVLELEIERPARQRISVVDEVHSGDPVLARLDRIEALLDKLVDERKSAPPLRLKGRGA